MSKRKGIGESKGNYRTKESTRASVAKYKDKYDVVQFRVPIGTRERIKKLKIGQKDLINLIAKEYLNGTGSVSKCHDNFFP